MSGSALGDFLRSRRGQVTPAQVGMAPGAGRRVPGLRREEVALLAGLSVDYYVRLERGRERSPSVQALDALSRALLLDDDGRLHLFRLAGMTPRALIGAGSERVSPDLLQLMQAWPENPALMLGRTYDVLARNRIGDALFDGFTHSDNLLLNVFLDPAAPAFYVDWESAAVNTVAGFRLASGAVSDDPRARALVRRLTERSPEFVAIWTRNQARGKSAEVKTFVHREVGELTLRMQTFDVRSSPGQQLVVYHAEPGSPSASAIRLLGTLAATADRDR